MTDVSMDLALYLNESDIPWLVMATDNVDQVGGTLYVNKMPPEPAEAVSILRYEGQEPRETFSNPLHVRAPRVQITVRDQFSEVALERAEEIMKMLCVIKDEFINGTRYERVKPVGEPFEIGPDSQERQRAVINFEASFYDSIGV